MLNGIYLFHKNYASSVSKYFTIAVHNALKPLILFKAYYSKSGTLYYDWRMSIEESPFNDWLFFLALCVKMLNNACKSKNILDVHTAQILTFILPEFINGLPDCSIENGYAHNYPSPLLLSVFLLIPYWIWNGLMTNLKVGIPRYTNQIF